MVNNTFLTSKNNSSKVEIKDKKLALFDKENNNKNSYINDNNNIFMDSELNSFSYEEAKTLDKRSFFQYYLSLIKTKNLLLFSFYPIKDYNSKIIKYSLFFFSRQWYI